jgi:hypothetical protein
VSGEGCCVRFCLDNGDLEGRIAKSQQKGKAWSSKSGDLHLVLVEDKEAGLPLHLVTKWQTLSLCLPRR